MYRTRIASELFYIYLTIRNIIVIGILMYARVFEAHGKNAGRYRTSCVKVLRAGRPKTSCGIGIARNLF